jgi:hypothetical protein
VSAVLVLAQVVVLDLFELLEVGYLEVEQTDGHLFEMFLAEHLIEFNQDQLDVLEN